MEGLKAAEANMVVYLHPSKAICVKDAILSHLSSLLFTYSEAFEGVVLAYNPIISSESAKILPGIHPYFGVKLKAQLLLFDPKPDMILEGEVVKITPQSIHAVVLGFSSVSIADVDIRNDFKHKAKGGHESYISRSNIKHTIKVGTILRFVVKSFDEEILHISGSLVDNRTGCARWLDKNVDEWSQVDRLTFSQLYEFVWTPLFFFLFVLFCVFAQWIKLFHYPK
ncbi:probable DNA-directed RNA polymerase i subunit rpa43 [Phtheirospermum japonicum]|uniref:DNA-directed RNA polymerase subunit n=1 Tax=Phtheirospermum japonicum TaxID=374723 RepID=A0A830CE15_9LAMI|nr:probable DNA-directed RNA polymerase i subunit rpa43 [Phtheirospermum japonicum]